MFLLLAVTGRRPFGTPTRNSNIKRSISTVFTCQKSEVLFPANRRIWKTTRTLVVRTQTANAAGSREAVERC